MKLLVFRMVLVLLLVWLALPTNAQPAGRSNPVVESGQESVEHLKYFGFTLIDVGWDDPTDETSKTNYIDEVAAFSNIADMLVVTPTDNIVRRLQVFDEHNVAAILHMSEIFFQRVGEEAPSQNDYSLRDDFKERWDTFCATNDIENHHRLIRAFYIGEEPTWNGISHDELAAATDYVKSTLPENSEAAIMVIEAFPALNDLRIPDSVDWIGFDHYFVKSPADDAGFQKELEKIRSLRKAHQKIVLVPDAHFIKAVHNHFGVQRSDLPAIASQYYQIAKEDSNIVALLCYFWPGGFDDPSALGTRNLDSNVRNAYERIGRSITGKE